MGLNWPPFSPSSLAKMIRVAIAGTNGLAQYIANFIDTQTSHQFVVLSRNASNLCSFY